MEPSTINAKVKKTTVSQPPSKKVEVEEEDEDEDEDEDEEEENEAPVKHFTTENTKSGLVMASVNCLLPAIKKVKLESPIAY